MLFPNDKDWYYEQIDLGYNYRMTDIHAALGLSQLSRLEHYVQNVIGSLINTTESSAVRMSRSPSSCRKLPQLCICM